MDYHHLSQIIEELSLHLPGARLERVFQGEDRDIYFLLRKDRKNFILLLSPLRFLPRVHLVSRKPRSVSDPHPLVLNLRSRLVGACLTHVRLLNQDRIIEMIWEKDSNKFRLIVELTGFSSNILFTDEKLNIIALYYPVVPSGRVSRMLLPGVQYVPPKKKMQDNFPRRVQDFHVTGSPNVSAEQYYADVMERRKSEALRLELRSFIKKAANKAERKRAALTGDLDAIGQPEEYRYKGELILAHLQKLRLGIEHAILTGYDGTDVHVSMDPQLTPQKNAELFFKKYKKAKTGLPLITDRLDETEEELAWLRSMMSKVEDAADIDSLNTLRSALVDRGLIKKGSGARRQTYPISLSGIKSINFQGWEILVGRSADANDRLTTRLARDNDLWLHAEGLAGSHVLIRNSRKMEIPPEVLLKAAAIAAFYSKGKESDKVPVTYAEARFIKKPKGAKPGTVLLSQRKTIMIRPSAD